MSPEERSLLSDLFTRTRGAASTPRDPEAEDLIQRGLREQPHAAYFLAQAVIIQDQALNALTSRIRELEDQIADLERQKPAEPAHQTSGGFLGGLSGLFGGGQSQTQAQRSGQLYDDFARSNSQRASAPAAPSPWGRDAAAAGPWGQAPSSTGGGFLRGALTTAAGVAGGVLVADAVRDLFSPHIGGSNGLFGSNFGSTGGLFGSGNTPVEETVVNNYFLNDSGDNVGNDSLQQADNPSNDGDDWFDASDDGGDSYA
ncbi:hypothetical protein M2360_002429 [Rhizobium sp. SG_E_25_P2]|uniref:DUF2076 domain-containing protein n=1 Tax=Rhizobium sp. SG_E_25_P2 TaxID=2879942 RepID=UPI00247466F3|nr:DUF2076 domain-containing protein [Rhizobium sp. SG_E_25_P2]MDH6267032.1 hypothetical protein [Rhizobium sp. SG_E_25_P2]